jgi:lipopolysaccharide export LptBFGC system permease protein LptF
VARPEHAFACALLRSAGSAVLVVAVVGTLVVTARAIASAEVVPSPTLALAMVVGLIPSALAVAIPVAVLVGAVAAADAWRAGGELIGLGSLGIPARRIGATAFAVGCAAALVEATFTHVLEPLGRSQVKTALVLATEHLQLQAEQPVRIGTTLVRAERVVDEHYEDVFLASGDLVVDALVARPESGGVLRLEQGHALRLGNSPTEHVRVSFDVARVPIGASELRRDAADLTDRALEDLVERMRGEGRSAAFEAMTLYKRTAIPLNVPLLALLGVPLGARGFRPAWAALCTAVGWWALLRICDANVRAIGPTMAVLVPWTGLMIATVVAWWRWPDR